VKLAVAISMIALFAACTDSETAPAKPSADTSARHDRKAALPSEPGCIDEFVQEFSEVAEDPPRPTLPGLCFAKNSPPEGPPKFPAMSRKIRIEYERGDYFVTQEAASWTIDEPATPGDCMVARLVKTRIVAISEGDKSESVQIEDGKVLRSADTGDQYRSAIALGSSPSDMDAVPGFRISRESTAFGHDCTRATQEGGFNSSTCSFVQPHRCRSVKKMLPAEIRTPNATGGVQVGRTTSFTTGGVDKSSWVLP